MLHELTIEILEYKIILLISTFISRGKPIMQFSYAIKFNNQGVDIIGNVKSFKDNFQKMWMLTQDDLVFGDNTISFGKPHKCQDYFTMLQYLRNFIAHKNVILTNKEEADNKVSQMIDEEIKYPCCKLLVAAFNHLKNKLNDPVDYKSYEKENMTSKKKL